MDNIRSDRIYQAPTYYGESQAATVVSVIKWIYATFGSAEPEENEVHIYASPEEVVGRYLVTFYEPPMLTYESLEEGW